VVNYADCRFAFLAVIAWKKILGFGKKSTLPDKLTTHKNTTIATVVFLIIYDPDLKPGILHLQSMKSHILWPYRQLYSIKMRVFIAHIEVKSIRYAGKASEALFENWFLRISYQSAQMHLHKKIRVSHKYFLIIKVFNVKDPLKKILGTYRTQKFWSCATGILNWAYWCKYIIFILLNKPFWNWKIS